MVLAEGGDVSRPRNQRRRAGMGQSRVLGDVTDGGGDGPTILRGLGPNGDERVPLNRNEENLTLVYAVAGTVASTPTSLGTIIVPAGAWLLRLSARGDWDAVGAGAEGPELSSSAWVGSRPDGSSLTGGSLDVGVVAGGSYELSGMAFGAGGDPVTVIATFTPALQL